MKKLYLIGGPMGVGKTTVCQALKKNLQNSVFLDGDWCWDMNPFLVTEETKRMVVENISYQLNQFIACSIFKHIIFCWVMHEQAIINDILSRIDCSTCEVKQISLICTETVLKQRLQADIDRGIRVEDILERSVARIPLYDTLNTIKIDTSNRCVKEIVEEIKAQ